MPANFPGSLPALATNKADATATATDHKDHHNQLGFEVNAIGARVIKEAPLNIRWPEYAASPANTGAQNVTAIQAALDAVPASGGAVYVPNVSGAYSINAPVKPKSNTHFFGDGEGSQLTVTGNTDVIQNKDGVSGNTQIHISGLRLNGTGTSGTPFQKGIRFDATTDFTINNVMVYNVYLQAINVDDCDRGRITECLVKESWGNGISLDNGCTDIAIEGNNVIDARDSGIGIHIRCRRIVVNGNTIAHTLATRDTADDGGVFGYGVDLYGSSEVVISNNTMWNTANHGIYAHTATEGGNYAPDRCIIQGNIIHSPRDRTGMTVTPGVSDGIQFFALADDEIHNCIVNGNVIYDPAGHGIYVGNGVHMCSFTNNNIVSAGLNGFLAEGVAGVPYRLLISGNWIRNCTGVGIQCTHVTTGECMVTGNYVMGNTGGHILFATPASNMIGPNSNINGNALELGTPMKFLNVAASSAENNSLFADAATSKLTFKDSGGALSSMESRGLKLPTRVAAPVNVTITAPGATIDGVTMAAADRVLLASQTLPAANGIYVWNGAAVAMTRATDSDTAAKLTDSLLVTVDEGTTNKDSIWTLSTNKPITLGTTLLRFTRIHPAAVAVSQPAGIYFAPAAAKMENMPRAQTDFPNQALLATGTVRVFPMGVLRAGDTLAALNFVVGTTASASITNSWAGIARLSDRVVLAVSATSTATTAANTLKTFTFTSAYTPDKDELLVGFVMYQATTPPSLFGINHGNAVIISTPPITNGTSNTGATTPVAVAATLNAFTADTEIPYCYAT